MLGMTPYCDNGGRPPERHDVELSVRLGLQKPFVALG